MDAYELFRKLSTGVKFDKKRFQTDAERFQLMKKQQVNTQNINNTSEAKEELNYSQPCKKGKYDGIGEETEESKLVLLEGITFSKRTNKANKADATFMEEKQQKLEREKVNQFRNQHRISITGNRVPKPISDFKELCTIYGISEKLVNNIVECGYQVPTPIQMQAIPAMLGGRQILACAPTGSGKTAAFLLPIIHHLGGPQKKGFRAIILSPTRELAKQTYRECMRLSEGFNFRVHIISKINQALQKYGSKSSQKFDILITTPKRIIYLLSQEPPAIAFNNVEWLIIDEADKLFEDGPRSFRAQLQAIAKACTGDKLKKAMFSATNTPTVTKWCRRNLKGLITITVGLRNAATDLVDQELLFVGAECGKLVALRNIIQKGVLPPVLVFVQSKERAQELFNELIYDGINVDVIHADRTQTQRDNVVRCFREGRIWVLICTELMARGIDFKGVNLVINYDFPPSAISYVHRIGRTGRAGHKGKAITFFTEQDTANLRSIALIMKESGCNVPDYMLAMKKHSKKERRKLEHSAPARERISTMPKLKHLHKRRAASTGTVNTSKGKNEFESFKTARGKERKLKSETSAERVKQTKNKKRKGQIAKPSLLVKKKVKVTKNVRGNTKKTTKAKNT